MNTKLQAKENIGAINLFKAMGFIFLMVLGASCKLNNQSTEGQKVVIPSDFEQSVEQHYHSISALNREQD